MPDPGGLRPSRGRRAGDDGIVTPASPPEVLERFGVGTTLEFMYRDRRIEVGAYS